MRKTVSKRGGGVAGRDIEAVESTWSVCRSSTCLSFYNTSDTLLGKGSLVWSLQFTLRTMDAHSEVVVPTRICDHMTMSVIYVTNYLWGKVFKC
jgi:hypothetical protein